MCATRSTAVIRQRRIPSQRQKDGLIRFANNRTSQNGEDGILDRIFSLLVPTSRGGNRWCVDVGAWDGQHWSNTYSLLQGHSEWRGILIEADANKSQELRQLYSGKDHVVCVQSTVSVNDSETNGIAALIQQHAPECPYDLDFLCVDIDGSDYWVWSDMLNESHFLPKVVCIEFNPSMPNDLIYIPPKDDSERHGASLAALVELADQHNYVLVETTLFNAFFVPRSLYETYLSHEVPDTSIESLHETTMGTTLYQLYDGTIKLMGCKKLLWHRVQIDEERIQVLNARERHFPFAPPIQQTDPFYETVASASIVNMSPYIATTASNNEQRSLCAQSLVSQLHQDGFCYVRGTGLSSALCRGALDATHALLQTADEDVRRSCLAPDRARRGYSPMNSENFASLLPGGEGPNDLVRKFRMGKETGADAAAHGTTALQQPNIWPNSNGWEHAGSFRESVQAYYDAVCPVAQTIVRAVCEGLILQQPGLASRLQPLVTAAATTSILTLLGYRSGTRHKGKKKGPLVAPHTDVGVLTVLIFEDAEGCAALERSDGEGGWLPVLLPRTIPEEDPIFVVNVADCFSAVVGGEITSTVHRVVARRDGSTAPRNCCALFVGLEPEAELHIKDEVVSFEEWRKRRVAMSQEALRSK